MILYTNGCSWTWGGALEPYFKFDNVIYDEKRLKLVWPHHLGNLLSADKVVNLGMGCGSNQRTVRTTFDWLTSQDKKTLEDTVAVIQLTEFNRFEIYEPKDVNKPFENLPNNWLNCKIDLITSLLPTNSVFFEDPHYIDMKNKVNERIANTSDIELMYNTLSYMHSLQYMFNVHGVKDVYFWHHGNQWHTWSENMINYIQTNFNILQQFPEKFKVWDYERVEGEGIHGHPSLRGHEQLAQHLHHDLIEKGLIR